MALLGDIIYHLEITENMNQLDLTDRDCIKTAKYLSNAATNECLTDYNPICRAFTESVTIANR